MAYPAALCLEIDFGQVPLYPLLAYDTLRLTETVGIKRRARVQSPSMSLRPSNMAVRVSMMYHTLWQWIVEGSKNPVKRKP